MTLKKEAIDYWEWNKKNPIKKIPSPVAQEGAGSELRSPLFHFGTVAPIYLATISYLKRLKPASGSKLIELGCGSGRFLSYLQSIFPSLEVWGVDYSDEAIRYAKKNYKKFGVHFKHTLAQKTYFHDRSFDFVISSHVIEHIKEEEGLKFLNEAKRLLKKTGYLFLGTPERRNSQDLFMSNPDDEPAKRLIPPHEHEYTLPELYKKASAVFGKENVEIVKILNPLFNKIYVSSINKLKPGNSIINNLGNNVYKLMKANLPKEIFDTIVRYGLELNLKMNNLTYFDILISNRFGKKNDKKIPDNLFLICKK